MMTADERGEATALIDFWFGPPRSPSRFQQRAVWFKVDPGFDAQLRERFGALQRRAAGGGYAAWAPEAEPCLALILLLDQLPRNLYRGTAQAFASDAQARIAARAALERGFDRSLPTAWRQFLYLPFEHSEALADQELSVTLATGLARDPAFAGALDYAQRHHAIVARFGRFPHRNAALGRASTAAEESFLTEPGSSF
ncbi:MAG TPA: DUF924 family protein [Stellaceae bacterium]|nr:DUF924 family protein [Stellaceae bacterium]